MNKKKLIPILIILISAISVFYMIDSRSSYDDVYKQYIQAARNAAEEGILVDAEANYQKALEQNPSIDLVIEMGDMYLKLGEPSDAYYWYERQIKDSYPTEPDAYAFGMKAAIACNRVENAFQIYDAMQKRKLVSEEADKQRSLIEYSFTLTERFQDAGPFGNMSGLAAVKTEDKWGFINKNGETKVHASFKKVGLMSEISPVIDENNEPFFIDKNGNRKINASFFEEKDSSFGKITEFLGTGEGRTLASNGSSVAFFDLESGNRLPGDYQNATISSKGVFGATKDGSTWALVNLDGTELTDYKYQEILVDLKGNPYRANALIVKDNDMYCLINENGNPISNEKYSKAYAFNDNGPAAVKKGDKWIFVEENGQEKDLGEFQEARSFSDGLAAVELNNKWGYINLDGEVVIEPQFWNAQPLSSFGVGFVETDRGVWRLLRLTSQNHEE